LDIRLRINASLTILIEEEEYFYFSNALKKVKKLLSGSSLSRLKSKKKY